MTISSALVAGKDPQTGVALACAPADAEPEHGQREREEVAEHRNEREGSEDERGDADEQRGPASGAAAGQRTVNGRRRSDAAEHAADPAGDRAGQLGEQPAHRRRRDQGDRERDPEVAKDADREDADRRPEARAIRRSSTRFPRRLSSVLTEFEPPVKRESSDPFVFPDPRHQEERMTDDARPLLVFFTSERSGPARRMESLLAHLARKERDRLRTTRVDVDARPELAAKFKVEMVPTLVLVKGKRAVGRIEGRASAPKIEEMLAEHLPEALPLSPAPAAA